MFYLGALLYLSRLLERFDKIIARKRITILIILNGHIIDHRHMMQILNDRINIEIIELLLAVKNVVLDVILDDATVNHFISFPLKLITT